jgi:hypothetical protein
MSMPKDLKPYRRRPAPAEADETPQQLAASDELSERGQASGTLRAGAARTDEGEALDSSSAEHAQTIDLREEQLVAHKRVADGR